MARFRLVVLALLLAVPLRVHAAETRGGWFSISTPHVTIAYEADDRRHAETLASFAEDVWNAVTGYFGTNPPPVLVMLRGRSPDPGGMFTWMPPRIELHVSPSANPLFGPSGPYWLRMVFAHELVHYVHMTRDEPERLALTAVLGHATSVADMADYPEWAVEGIATNLETALTGIGRGRSTWFETMWKACVLGQEYPRLEEASSSGPLSEPPGRHYVTGYVFVAWLRATFGSDVFARIEKTRRGRDLLFGMPFADAVRETTGSSIDELYDRMRADLARLYRDDLDIEGGTTITPVTRGTDWYLPSRVIAGKPLAVASIALAFPRIALLDPANGNHATVVEADIASSSFASTADGARMVWVERLRESAGSFASTRLALVVGGPDGSRRVLTGAAAGSLGYPSTSDDGAVLVATRFVDGRAEIVRVAEDGSARTIWSREGLWPAASAVSPDGSRIAFAAAGPKGWRLVAIAPEGGNERQWELPAPRRSSLFGADGPGVQENATIWSPRFAPDGSILFASDARGRWEGWRLDPETDEATLVAVDPVGVMGVMEADGAYWYSAYTHRGWALKRVDNPVPGESLRAVRVGEARAVEAGTPLAFTARRSFEERPWRDAPENLLVVPFATTCAVPGGSAFGFGLAHFAASRPLDDGPVGDTFAVALAWYPELGQIDAWAEAELSLGFLDLHLSFARVLGLGTGSDSDRFLARNLASVSLSSRSSSSGASWSAEWLASLGLSGATESFADAVPALLDEAFPSRIAFAAWAGVEWRTEATTSFADALPPLSFGTSLWGAAIVEASAGFEGVSAAWRVDARAPLGPLLLGVESTLSARAGGPEAARANPPGLRLPDSGADATWSLRAALLLPVAAGGAIELAWQADFSWFAATGAFGLVDPLAGSLALVLEAGGQTWRLGYAWTSPILVLVPPGGGVWFAELSVPFALRF